MLPYDPQYEVSRRKGEAQQTGNQYPLNAQPDTPQPPGLWQTVASVVRGLFPRRRKPKTRGEEAKPVLRF